jgi:hypothetical protein
MEGSRGVATCSSRLSAKDMAVHRMSERAAVQQRVWHTLQGMANCLPAHSCVAHLAPAYAAVNPVSAAAALVLHHACPARAAGSNIHICPVGHDGHGPMQKQQTSSHLLCLACCHAGHVGKCVRVFCGGAGWGGIRMCRHTQAENMTAASHLAQACTVAMAALGVAQPLLQHTSSASAQWSAWAWPLPAGSLFPGKASCAHLVIEASGKLRAASQTRLSAAHALLRSGHKMSHDAHGAALSMAYGVQLCLCSSGATGLRRWGFRGALPAG